MADTVINIQDASIKSSAITMADIEKAMKTVRATGGPVGLGALAGRTSAYWETNPCSEIPLVNRNPVFELNETPPTWGSWRENVLSTESGNKVFVQNGYNDSLDVDFDEAVWRIYMPGVPKEDVQVFTVRDKVYVDVSSGAPRKTFKLADGETVKSTKLELGVLTITIDRPDKRVAVEVA